MTNYDEMAREIYEQNKAVGWWDDPNRCIYQTMQLISTEIAEATEGERKNLMDDHLPWRRMGEVELADAMIRLLDIAGRYGWEFYTSVQAPGKFNDPALSIGGKHLFLNVCLVDLLRTLPADLEVPHYDVCYHYSQLVNAIESTAQSQGYDLLGAIQEKLAYNATRSDHKRENRAKDDGKKF